MFPFCYADFELEMVILTHLLDFANFTENYGHNQEKKYDLIYFLKLIFIS